MIGKLKPKEIADFERDKDLLKDFLENQENYLSRINDPDVQSRVRHLLTLSDTWKNRPIYHDAIAYELRMFAIAIKPIKNKFNGTSRKLEEKFEVPDQVLETPVVEPEQVVKTVKTEEPIEKEIIVPRTSRVSLEDLVRYYKYKGVVGEESTCVLQTFGAISQLYFGIESLSGSGKSFVVEPLVELLPKGSVYRMELSSEQAEWYNQDTINKAKIIYIPELQKATGNGNKVLVEVLKNLTEGKDVVRRVTDAKKKRVVEFRIRAGKGVIYTLAYENNFKKDTELARRVFQLYTDISEDQTRQVLKSIAAKQWNPQKETMSAEELDSLKTHISDCLNLPRLEYVNPFADAIVENMPLTIRARSFSTHYLNLIKGSSRYHFRDRVVRGDNLFVNLEDVYIVHRTYGRDFVKTVLQLPLEGERILDSLDKLLDGRKETDPEWGVTAKQVYEQIRQQRAGLTLNLVRGALDQLTEIGYLENEGKDYRKLKEYSCEDSVDWQTYWQTGLQIMQQHYPNVAEEWQAIQFTGSKLMVYDPFENKQISLLEKEVKNGTS